MGLQRIVILESLIIWKWEKSSNPIDSRKDTKSAGVKKDDYNKINQCRWQRKQYDVYIQEIIKRAVQKEIEML